MDSKWYVLHVRTGCEQDVIESVKPYGITALAPEEQRLIRRGGQWQPVRYRLMPGYVFVHCAYTSPLYYVIKDVPGVIRWLAADGKPSPLSDEEAVYIVYLGRYTLRPSVVERLADGECHVCKGPLVGLEDRIDKVDWHRKRALIHVPLLGHDKPIWLSISSRATQQ